MAKSLRSKWKRKMKAVKREKYGAKENDRLIKMLTAAGEYPQVAGEVKLESDSEITETSSPSTTLVTAIRRPLRPRRPRADGRIRKSRKDWAKEDEEEEVIDEEMEDVQNEGGSPGEMLVDKPEHVFSKRSMKDQFGNYPAWMNKRKMKTQQKKNKRISKRRALSVAGGKRKR